MIPWGCAKPPGLSDSEPLYTLWRFAGSNWLAGSNMNDMLELPHYKINSDPVLVKNSRVQGTALIPKFLEAYHTTGDSTSLSEHISSLLTDTSHENIWERKDLRWIRDAADDMVQKKAALMTSAHLGRVTDEPHWVSIIFDCREKPVVRYGDSFGSPIPEELAAACDWWLGQHTFTDITHAKLPMAKQEDGFSCGMLVDNSHHHFIDPTVSLSSPIHVANAGLEVFNKIAARGLEQSDAPILLLRRTARRAKFNFTSAPPSPASLPPPAPPVRPTAGKRPNGHPDAPTPNPSPQKHRLFKRQADNDDLGLLTVSGSDDSDDDDDNNSTDAEAPSTPPAAPRPAPRPAHPAKPAAAAKVKLTAFFKVETAEEKAVHLEKDAREYREHAEEVQLRELEITRGKKAKARADGNERTRQYRDRIRAAKIADGYVPGTKRTRVDLLDDDPSLNPDPRLAELSWSKHRATKAAQKLPANHENVLEEAFFREAYIIRDYAIPAALCVNTDQIQLVYQQGSGSTWTQRGAKQVATVGQEEKRAFTLVPLILASSVLLPMQSVFMGKTDMSCPSPKTFRYEEAVAQGYVTMPSKSTTYWSTLHTMQDLVNDIITPYKMKIDLGLPSSQMSIRNIDCWSAFEMCRVRDWNRSQAPLTSPEALAVLHELRTTNLVLHAALTQEHLVDDGDDGDDPYSEVDVYDDCQRHPS
ncbi:hypothetical protein B0H13DRAFT_2565823 [Mycena leptocephala]|nr:hypothetical protein B0H13DRAFT_2565823 [Mycena leptocephala]